VRFVEDCNKQFQLCWSCFSAGLVQHRLLQLPDAGAMSVSSCAFGIPASKEPAVALEAFC